MKKHETFELNDEQFKRIIDASKPVPYLVFKGVEPESPRARAERVWRELGSEMGFQWETVRPAAGKSERFFTAIPTGTTPRPWMCDPAAGAWRVYADRDGARIAEDVSEHDARLIVTAVNNHEALVEFVRGVIAADDTNEIADYKRVARTVLARIEIGGAA